MQTFTSTRAHAPHDFIEAAMSTLAAGGGLSVPTEWPTLPATVRNPAADGSSTYTETGLAITQLFAAGTPAEAMQAALWQDYATAFPVEPAPLVTLQDNLHVLELFHGPTLSFKDYALQWVGRLINALLGDQQRTILAATSGDTGAAALAAVAHCPQLRCIVLHPLGRVSDIQRKQMTTIDNPRVMNIAIEGSFDDCQNIVKAIFSEQNHAHALLAMNSINFMRVIGQIVFYVDLCRRFADANERGVDVVVPTGNFGNVYSAWAAQQLGAPLRKLGVASNANDAVVTYLQHHRLQSGTTTPTWAPAMDIQIPSNLERLVYAHLGCDPSATAAHYATLRAGGTPDIPQLAAPNVWQGYRADDPAIIRTMQEVKSRYNYTLDPHSAAAFASVLAQDATVDNKAEAGHRVVVATAHPAKFQDACMAAYGQEVELPPELAMLDGKRESYTVLPASVEAVRAELLKFTSQTAF